MSFGIWRLGVIDEVKAKVLVEKMQLGMAGAVILGGPLENENEKAAKKAVAAEKKDSGRL